MIRITLMAAVTLATIATASSALAQAGAPVRTRNPSAPAEVATVLTAEHMAALCADKSCAGKPLKRGYVAPPPLGW